MTDQELMAAIRAKYGSWIKQACRDSAIPPALVAALVANESGLDEGATRLEPGVYIDLMLVCIGRKASFNEIGARDLQTYLGDLTAHTAVLALANLATSWGPCQVMGWQALRRGYPLADLSNLETHFVRVAAILRDFAKAYPMELSPTAAGSGPIDWPPPAPFWGPWFRCWNAGRPDGKTFDPNYAANGVRRLALYDSLLV